MSAATRKLCLLHLMANALLLWLGLRMAQRRGIHAPSPSGERP